MCVSDEGSLLQENKFFITIIWTQNCLLLSDDVCMKEIATTLSLHVCDCSRCNYTALSNRFEGFKTVNHFAMHLIQLTLCFKTCVNNQLIHNTVAALLLICGSAFHA